MDASWDPKRPRSPLAGCSHNRSLNEEEEEIQPCYHRHLPSPAEHVKSLTGSGDDMLSYQELKEENCMLKKKIQTFSANLAQVLRNLERTPPATMSKEEKDIQDLETLVQQMDQNVHVMTEKALKAKCDSEKMKQEMSFLQAELACYKLENRSLRSGYPPTWEQ